MTNVYISGLRDDTTEEALETLFRRCGAIVSSAIFHGNSGNFGCYGFVNFTTVAGAQAAISSMHGANYKGGTLQVKLATQNKTNTGNTWSARTYFAEGRATGVVNNWKGGHGWITPDIAIEHPEVGRHKGGVFVSLQDVDGQQDLKAGYRVSFRLYADSDGIGAADVRRREEKADFSRSNNNTELPPSQKVVRSPWRPQNASSTRKMVGDSQAERISQTVLTVHDDVAACSSRQHVSTVGCSLGAQIFVRGWPSNLQEADVRQAFEQFGEIGSLLLESSLSENDQDAIITFLADDSARQAVEEMNGAVYGGKAIEVGFTEDSVQRVSSRGLMTQVRISEKRMFGSVCEWRRNHGFIIADSFINHPAITSAKHKGRIYVNSRDLQGISKLTAGDRVSFIAYADWDGLGAAEVRVESQRMVASSLQGADNSSLDECIGAPIPWWHEKLAGDCCPLSLTSFEELAREPFGILGVSETNESHSEGLFGAAALAACLSEQIVHWFDGLHLACSIVSQGQMSDPVNMRKLSRSECQSLDDYLSLHRLPTLSVAEAFDLSQLVEAGAAAHSDVRRLTVLGEEAASILRIHGEGSLIVENLGTKSASSSNVERTSATSSLVAPDPSEARVPSSEVVQETRRRRWGNDK